MRLVAVLAVVVAVVFQVEIARADEIGGARFAVPNGWSAIERDGTRVVAPTSLANGELMMGVVLGAQPITGTPAAKLGEIARTLNSDAKTLATSQVASAPRGAAGTLHYQVFDVESKDMGKHTRVAAIFVRGGQCAIMVFVISNAATLEKYSAGFQAALGSLDIAGPPSATTPSAPSAPTPPAPTPPTTTRPTATASSTSSIPTGSTPDKYPGSSGFRPSGRGVAVPIARVVDGRPQGLWWYPQLQNGKAVALRVIYLADGTCATSPRPGGPTLFDVEGQRRLGGVGTCSVENGAFSRTIDGHTQGGAFAAGTDKEGAYMSIGAARHRPLAAVDAKLLVGTWKSPGNTYEFRADGTYTSGNLTSTSAIGKRGTWAVEGYTLFVRPEGEDGWVSTIGATAGSAMVIDSAVYLRAQ